ncbi:hypothetical protein [Chryseobacterium sp.]|jgi:hypothetical protein|uniref:hypothetical protein n=1 Tax=Chryseobacterium sp. TaxID=1871047 RepID=UPI00284349FC|nr:hypothetical protein [Chryseobacterium sp.]MDR3026029.1 hypothetical protein [Chryseobacterium sp.]
MSHQEKQRIFDQLVQNIDPETIRQGSVPLDQYEDWEDLLLAFRYNNISLQSLTKIIFEACNLIQEEQQKRIAERACIEPKGMMTRVDKSSIINPENKIQ